MRGSQELGRRTLSRLGIIPAHAGLTLWSASIMYHSRDHPRACGAHRCLKRSPSPLAGSSPRMRGSLDGREERAALLGIIPAHAGLTLWWLRRDT